MDQLIKPWPSEQWTLKNLFLSHFEISTLAGKSGRLRCLSDTRWPEKGHQKDKLKTLIRIYISADLYIITNIGAGNERPNKEQTDLKGIKMTALAAPDQMSW